MVEENNSVENTPVEDLGNSDNLEELRVEDAAAEIDFDVDFQSSGEADQNSGDRPVAEHPSDTEALIDVTVITELQQQLDSLKGQLEERTSQYLRITADFENFRKRTSREKEELESQIKCNTISSLLEVVDNFERARAQIKPQNDSEMVIHKSYQGVYKQLVEGLKRLGVSPMRAEGQEFDPNLHEAVMREPTHEYPEGTVIEEFVRGYLLGERVLRHAMVKVATLPEGVPVQGKEPDESSE
jgi:molecular chaperone GrpE